MKAKEVKEMTSAELTAKLAELKSELFNLRFRLASGQLENPVSIAIWDTELSEKCSSFAASVIRYRIT